MRGVGHGASLSAGAEASGLVYHMVGERQAIVCILLGMGRDGLLRGKVEIHIACLFPPDSFLVPIQSNHSSVRISEFRAGGGSKSCEILKMFGIDSCLLL